MSNVWEVWDITDITNTPLRYYYGIYYGILCPFKYYVHLLKVFNWFSYWYQIGIVTITSV